MQRRCLTSPGIIFCYEDLTTWKYFTKRESAGSSGTHFIIFWSPIIFKVYRDCAYTQHIASGPFRHIFATEKVVCCTPLWDLKSSPTLSDWVGPGAGIGEDRRIGSSRGLRGIFQSTAPDSLAALTAVWAPHLRLSLMSNASVAKNSERRKILFILQLNC